MTILQTLRKKYLQYEVAKVKGKNKEAYTKEIAEIQASQDERATEKRANEAAEKIARQAEMSAYREEEVKQASVLGKAKAQINTQKRIQQIQQTGGRTGFMAGLDKFLSNTGVAQGTARVLGNAAIRQPSFNVVTGYGGQRAPDSRIPIRRPAKRRHKVKHHKRRKVYYQPRQPAQPSFNIVTGGERRII